MEEQTQWFTVLTLAQRLGLSERTIRELIYKGEIPARKFGKQWRINPNVLVNDD